MLAYNDEASRITLAEQDVQFLDLPESEDSTRVRHLGEYSVEISMKGSGSTVKRKVHVVAQKADGSIPIAEEEEAVEELVQRFEAQ
jgi:hypothetical protein